MSQKNHTNIKSQIIIIIFLIFGVIPIIYAGTNFGTEINISNSNGDSIPPDTTIDSASESAI